VSHCETGRFRGGNYTGNYQDGLDGEVQIVTRFRARHDLAKSGSIAGGLEQLVLSNDVMAAWDGHGVWSTFPWLNRTDKFSC